jgi:hypothetical protein
MAMGSSSSAVTATFIMVDFEEMALNQVEDTFVI